ncbi:MAG: fibrillarin-like rRNA/tRNA 2'-O-methyltransferase [Candidatus Woesearchaeota archaeon]
MNNNTAFKHNRQKPKKNFSKKNSKSSFHSKPKKPFNKSLGSRDGSNRFSKPSPQNFLQVQDGLNKINKFPGVFSLKKGRLVKYLVKTTSKKNYFEENVLRINDKWYREVDPERSKLFASIAKGISQIGFTTDSTVLYLGASHGYTVSFLSDMVRDGYIYALDFAPRVLRDLVFLCEQQKNVAPLMADANRPAEYKKLVGERVDVVFMDISQRNQVEIFLKNCDMFLDNGGFGLLALKSQSVDVTKKPKQLFKEVREELQAHKGLVVVDYKELDPFEKHHAMFIVKKK